MRIGHDFSRRALLLEALLAAAFLAGCAQERPAALPAAAPAAAPESARTRTAFADRPAPNPQRNVYFGAVHVHTGYSFDAFINGTVSRPGDAYAWAKGKPIPANRTGLMLQVKTPLDFYAVSDHAEMMGVLPRMADPNDPLSK